jgi:chemotaxis protein MotA
MIVTLVSFSEKTRREGLLSLDDDLDALDDPFLKKGLQLALLTEQIQSLSVLLWKLK